MPYRYVIKHVVSRALGSYLATGLKGLSQDAFWERLEASKYLTPDQMRTIRKDVEAALADAEAKGKMERDLLEQLVREALLQLLKPKDKE